ncbi:helix-turn-helix domain-containing protein [Listeria rocourtiae]|uniref:helix-turn-helix domain-containing protein n=1 Tax=Listeria rocourtiae TaxID=647910 RepID=UPI00162A9BAA|nr:helix-turn-helix domain-containing protein [Listeria rocourtiae]MBC1605350.1 helix-turn-helix domain-containing protein [Listeria rocourtiae]
MNGDIQELYLVLAKYFFTTSEAIEYLGINRNTFYSLVSRGKITKIKKSGVVLYPRFQVVARKNEMNFLQSKYRPYELGEAENINVE